MSTKYINKYISHPLVHHRLHNFNFAAVHSFIYKLSSSFFLYILFLNNLKSINSYKLHPNIQTVHLTIRYEQKREKN